MGMFPWERAVRVEHETNNSDSKCCPDSERIELRDPDSTGQAVELVRTTKRESSGASSDGDPVDRCRRRFIG